MKKIICLLLVLSTQNMVYAEASRPCADAIKEYGQAIKSAVLDSQEKLEEADSIADGISRERINDPNDELMKVRNLLLEDVEQSYKKVDKKLNLALSSCQ